MESSISNGKTILYQSYRNVLRQTITWRGEFILETLIFVKDSLLKKTYNLQEYWLAILFSLLILFSLKVFPVLKLQLEGFKVSG